MSTLGSVSHARATYEFIKTYGPHQNASRTTHFGNTSDFGAPVLQQVLETTRSCKQFFDRPSTEPV